jgi:dynein heavy chain, axonemal
LYANVERAKVAQGSKDLLPIYGWIGS